MADNYTAREVEWLLSMSHADALACDSSPRDSWPDLLSSDTSSHGAALDGAQVLVVLRWHDVHQARGRVQGAIDEHVAHLVGQGYTQEEIGEVLGRSQQYVSKQWRATVVEILLDLSGSRAA